MGSRLCIRGCHHHQGCGGRISRPPNFDVFWAERLYAAGAKVSANSPSMLEMGRKSSAMARQNLNEKLNTNLTSLTNLTYPYTMKASAATGSHRSNHRRAHTEVVTVEPDPLFGCIQSLSARRQAPAKGEVNITYEVVPSRSPVIPCVLCSASEDKNHQVCFPPCRSEVSVVKATKTSSRLSPRWPGTCVDVYFVDFCVLKR